MKFRVPAFQAYGNHHMPNLNVPNPQPSRNVKYKRANSTPIIHNMQKLKVPFPRPSFLRPNVAPIRECRILKFRSRVHRTQQHFNVPVLRPPKKCENGILQFRVRHTRQKISIRALGPSLNASFEYYCCAPEIVCQIRLATPAITQARVGFSFCG